METCNGDIGCKCARCSRDRKSLISLYLNSNVYELINYVVFSFRLRDLDIKEMREALNNAFKKDKIY